MAKNGAGALSLFFFIVLVLASRFLTGAAEGPVHAEKQVMRNGVSTQKDGVVHAGLSGGGGGRGSSGGGGGSGRGGSPSGSRGRSNGKSNRGTSGLPYGRGTTVGGAHGGSADGKHSGGSRSWSGRLVASAAATVIGIVV